MIVVFELLVGLCRPPVERILGLVNVRRQENAAVFDLDKTQLATIIYDRKMNRLKQIFEGLTQLV
jgi:hypothetical protein